MLPRIFDLFAQERQEIDRSDGGLGLGLAIVKSLMRAHGGAVEAHSDGKNRGARFSIRMPLAERVTEEPRTVSLAAPAPVSAADPGLRILVVDDNADAARLLSDSLQALGHRAVVAFDGPSALERASAFHPDVVLLDIAMPGLSGLDFQAELAKVNVNIPIIFITASKEPGFRQRASELKAAGYFEKPYEPQELLTAIQAALSE
jgi:CheY-like chemotaxis protein